MFYGRMFIRRHDHELDSDSAKFCDPGQTRTTEANLLQKDSEGATLVVSATTTKLETCQHMPVIDLDVSCYLIPSSKPGHSHLYINHPMSQAAMLEILDVLAKHGVVESGYALSAKRRGYAAVRLPWVAKKDIS